MALDEAAWGRFTALFDEDVDDVRELVVMFVDESHKLGADVEEGITTGDANRFRRAAHNLKSTSRQLGGSALAVTCQAIEDAGQDADLAAAATLLSTFRDQLQTLQNDLRERLGL